MTKQEIKKRDKEFSEYIRKRDGKCLICSKITNLQCAHLISRTAREYRWDEKNAITLCYSCHFYKWHRDPLFCMSWILSEQPWIYEFYKLNGKK